MFLKDKYQNHTIEVQTELNILETQKNQALYLKIYNQQEHCL